MAEAPLRCLGRMNEHVEHDWCATQVRDPMLDNRSKNRRRINAAQTDVSAGDCGHRPGIGPAVAMEHRQGPQIDRVVTEPKGDRVADRIQKSAAVVVDDAFWIARGS